jgi:hypothetical protein
VEYLPVGEKAAGPEDLWDKIARAAFAEAEKPPKPKPIKFREFL